MKKTVVILLVAVLLSVSLSVPAAAIARPAASQIPVGTLVIGTHLIYAVAMTNAVYEAALSSMSDPTLNAQQNSIYYKSEFAGGQWLDISSATNIYDLSAVSGKFVDNSVIDALTLKFYTMPDGKTYNLTTGGLVAVSDIISPYDPKAQAEMEPLVSNLSALDSENEDNGDAISILAGVLSGSYSDSYTAYLDSAIRSLNSSLNEMRSAGATIQKQESMSALISTLDHRRRARSLNLMRNKLLEALSKAGEHDLQGLISTMSPVVDALETKIQEHLAAGGDDGARGPDSSGNPGIGSQQSESESGKAKIRKELEDKLIDALSSGGQSEETDKLLKELENMNNLDSGAVVSSADEIAAALEMVDSLTGEFIEKLEDGAIAELFSASPDDPYALRAAEEKQSEIFENARLELQSAVAAAGLRMGAEDYESLASDLMAKARDMEGKVKDDASKPAALETVQKYMDWLGFEHIKAGEESENKSEAQLMQIEINRLEEQSKAALDKNDLAAADALDGKIESISAQLSALEENLAAGISAKKESLEKLKEDAKLAAAIGEGQLAEALNAQVGELQSEINSLEVSLPSDVRAAQGEITRLKQEALQAVEQGNVPDAVSGIESISAFSDREPVAAVAAVKAVEDAMLRQKALFGKGGGSGGNPDEAKKQLSEIIPELRDKVSELGANNASAKISKNEAEIKKLEQEMKAAKAAGNGILEESLYVQIESLKSELKDIEANLPTDILNARKEIARLGEDALKAAEQGNKSALGASVNGISALAGKEPVSALEAVLAIDSALSKPENAGTSGDVKKQISDLISSLRGKVSEISAFEASAEISAAETSVDSLKQEKELAEAVGDGKLIAGLESKIESLQEQIQKLKASVPAKAVAAREEIAKLEQDALKAIEQENAQILAAIVDKISELAGSDPVAALEAASAIDSAMAGMEAMSATRGADFDAALEMLSQLLPELGEKASAIGRDDSQKLRELCKSMLGPLPNEIPARLMAVLQIDGGRADKNLLALADEYYAAFPEIMSFTITVNDGEIYVPAAVLPQYLNLRFLPEKNDKFLLTNGAVYYRFTRGGKAVEIHTGGFDMVSPAYYSGNVAYLPESFVKEQLGMSVVEITHRGKTAVLINQAGAAKAAEIVAAMKGG